MGDCFGWNGEEPECVDSYWTKVNYLGNADNTLRGGKQAHYDWTLPSWQSLTDDHFCWSYSEQINYDNDQPMAESSGTTTAECVRMVFRIRYNMSTMDYDPYKTNSTHDYEPQEGILSPIEENPEVDVGFYVQGLQLAINTAQTGRTFQDRSHTFLVCKRDASSDWVSKPLLNVNVRGKRGNINQTFPATQYDFEPQHVKLLPNSGQCLHFQWCGSNTHNNGNPGGDGQTGDDGQGRGGSDRSNLVKVIDSDDDDFFDYVNCYHPFRPTETVSNADAQLILSTAGFYKGVDYRNATCDAVTECNVDELLNNVPASFRVGLICCLKDGLDSSTRHEFKFLSTRSNTSFYIQYGDTDQPTMDPTTIPTTKVPTMNPTLNPTINPIDLDNDSGAVLLKCIICIISLIFTIII